MKAATYEYVLVQYCHDPMRCERLNVAVLLRDSFGRVSIRVPASLGRLKRAFPNVDLRTIRDAIRCAEISLANIGSKVNNASFSNLISALFPCDEAGFRFSDVRVGLGSNTEVVLAELVARFVSDANDETSEVLEVCKLEPFHAGTAEKRIIRKSSNEEFYEGVPPERLRA